MPPDPAPELLPTRVWDLPTRVFHWTLALCILAAVISAKIGGNAMPWHFRLGYVIFALLVFRVLWGLVGGHWSRFTSFVRSPGTVLRYLRGQVDEGELLDVGHNPLGSLSVLAMLAVMAVQVGTGLVADDEIANQGPLNALVSSERALQATGWHQHLGQWLLLALVGLHVAAIAWYRLRQGKDLVRPMIVGDRSLPAGTPASADGQAQRVLALLLLAACAGLVAWVVQLRP